MAPQKLASSWKEVQRQVGDIVRVPRSVSPSAEGHFVRWQRRTVGAFHESVRMLLKQVRIGLGYKWSHPDSRLESAPANLREHAQHVAAASLAGFQPVPHPWRISILH